MEELLRGEEEEPAPELTSVAEGGDDQEENKEKGDPQYDWVGEGMRAREAAEHKGTESKEEYGLAYRLRRQKEDIMAKKTKGGPARPGAPPTGLVEKMSSRRSALAESSSSSSDSDFSDDDCEEREKTDNPCMGGASASQEIGVAKKAMIASAQAKKEKAEVDGANWKPIPQVLGADWAEWAEYEINKERTMARLPLGNGEYVYYTAIKDGAGMIENFTKFKDGDLSV